MKVIFQLQLKVRRNALSILKSPCEAELIRNANLGKKLSPEMKEKLALNSKNAKQVLVVNNETLETYEFTSITAAVKKN